MAWRDIVNRAQNVAQTTMTTGRKAFAETFATPGGGRVPGDDPESRAPLVHPASSGPVASASVEPPVAGIWGNVMGAAKLVANKATVAGQKAKDSINTARGVQSGPPQLSMAAKLKRYAYGTLACILLMTFGPSVLSLLTGTAGLVKQIRSDGPAVADHVTIFCRFQTSSDAFLRDVPESVDVFRSVRSGEFQIRETRKTEEDFGDDALALLKSILGGQDISESISSLSCEVESSLVGAKRLVGQPQQHQQQDLSSVALQLEVTEEASAGVLIDDRSVTTRTTTTEAVTTTIHLSGTEEEEEEEED